MNREAQEGAPATRVFVYGSCVSRDSLAYVAGAVPVAYVARQSLISASSPSAAPGLVAEAGVTSRFQRRMLDGDVRGDLWEQLKKHAHQTDLVLCDLTDERLGVYELDDGSVVTRSLELIASGVETEVAGRGRLLAFGSDEHFARWCQGLGRLSSELNRLGLHDRTVFLLLPWTSRGDHGGDLPSSFGTGAAEANLLFGRYEEQVRGTFPRQTISLPVEQVRTDANHRWGAAPFHYDGDTYEKVASSLSSWLVGASVGEALGPTTRTRRPRGPVVIFGSCVSRDTFEAMRPRRPLAAYVARQSVISSFSPPVQVGLDGRLPSAFQQRMLEGDVGSSLLPTLRQHARSTSLLMVDLVDERHGVYRLGDGAWVTNSAELRRSGLLHEVDHSRLVEFGTDRHFELWHRAFTRFHQQLVRYDLLDRTVVIKAPFAEFTADGDRLPPFAGVPAAVWNDRYERYYGIVAESGLPMVTISQPSVFSDRNHKWQPEPFHYVQSAYTKLLEDMGRLGHG